MIRRILMVGLFLIQIGLAAQTVHVGLYQEQIITKAVVYCSSGSYTLICDGVEMAMLEPGEILYLTLEEGHLRVLDSENDYGDAEQVELRAMTMDAFFRVRPIAPELESKDYDDNLKATAGEGFISLVNRVDMDKYLAGVIQSAAGVNAHLEFYKAQAILCRTFALKHNQEHVPEGFGLCDGAHCQTYKGRSTQNPEILEAVLETTGLIAADFNYKLIDAAYHINSGGQTQRGSDIWPGETEYLQAVVDPYSLHQSHAKWQDTILFGEWKDYLRTNGMKSVDRIPEEIIYVEQMRRKKDFILDKDSLRMTTIREDWGFHSAFFDMFPEGDSVLVWGKGFGHGIGMSQEGAMKMANDDFTYQDILLFYFHEIRIMDYRDLPASSLSMHSFQ
ncbi:MAG: SpoIID/LytB domain-containing protein [Bacteroides sp.]|nr:SpoIID/LytB domain-containing protein [Bacteroides sp.]